MTIPGRTPTQDVNFADMGGWTPLHKAAKAGQGAVVEVLLRCGALPDVATKLGETALIKVQTRIAPSSSCCGVVGSPICPTHYAVVTHSLPWCPGPAGSQIRT